MPFSAQKMHFFDKKCNIYPCPTSSNFDVKKLFIPLVFIYFNSEGFVGGGWRRWWNPPLNIFNLARNGSIFGRFEKKVSISDWNHMHNVFFFSLRVNLTPKVFIVPCLSYYHIMLLLSFLIMNCLLFWVKQPDNPRVCINTENCNYNWTVIQFKVHCLDGQSFNLTCVQPRKQTILSPCRVVM